MSGSDDGLRRGSPIWAVLAAAVLVVAGCSGGEEPPPPPKSSSVTSQTTTATTSTAAPSGIPAAARAHTPAGAVAFVRYFIERVNYAWTTPQPGAISALSEQACKSCADLEKTAGELALLRHRYDAPVVSVASLTNVASKPGIETVLFVGSQRKANVVDAAGRVVSSDPQQSSRRIFVLAWHQQRWSVAQIGDAKNA